MEKIPVRYVRTKDLPIFQDVGIALIGTGAEGFLFNYSGGNLYYMLENITKFYGMVEVNLPYGELYNIKST